MATKRKREWFDDESFWRDLYLFMFPPERLAAGTEEVDRILALARPPGRSALDLCCGPGRIAVPLARRGFSVTGVDRTRFLLDKARARARRVKSRPEWVRADMRDFVRPEAFDLALNLFTSFGYFDDREADLTVLRNVLTSLRPRGVFVIDGVGKELLARIFQPTTSQTLADGSRLVERHEIFDDWTRIRNEWILVRKGRARTFRFHHTVYSGQELKDRLLGVGFDSVRLFGSLAGEPYGLDAGRLVAVARKAARRRARSR
jgi:SAM-dependent methyltransferase